MTDLLTRKKAGALKRLASLVDSIVVRREQRCAIRQTCITQLLPVQGKLH